MIALEALSTETQAYQLGEKLYRRGSVSHGMDMSDTLSYDVGTTPSQTVSFSRSGNAVCTCGGQREPCEHVIAALLATENDGLLRRFCRDGELELGQRMLTALTRAMPGGETVRLMTVLRLGEDGKASLGLSIGQERLYAVKSIPDLLTCFSIGATLEISPKFVYRPNVMRFSKEDERLLSMLSSHVPLKADSLKAWENEDHSMESEPEEPPLKAVPSDGRFLILNGPFLQSVMRFLETHSFVLQTGDEKQIQNGIKKEELSLCFAISLTPTELCVVTEGAEHLRLITPDARYVLTNGYVTHLHTAQARVCRLLLGEGLKFRYPAKEAEEALAILLPALSAVGTVAPSPELNARLVTSPLKAAVYLDVINSNVEARVEFHYGDTLLLPFAAADGQEKAGAPTLSDGKMLLRDGRTEAELLELFSDAGFVVRGEKIVLRRSKDILAFCTQGVTELNKRCEVYASQSFERVKPRRFVAKAAFHMRGGRLVFSLLENGEAAPELTPILKAISQRQQYVRLKTGEFLDVRDMMALAPVVQELLDAAELDDPHADEEARELNFGAYRAAYMVSMLRMAGAQTETDAEAENAIESLGQTSYGKYMPQKLHKKLSPYQLRGSDWLCNRCI
ncbi:MAG: SNF2 helicase associated domain-containing protein [Eubacteriales bacterium]|nr:SNF2 helicase associated domain-containing protein [Eubacteriales bacterium]